MVVGRILSFMNDEMIEEKSRYRDRPRACRQRARASPPQPKRAATRQVVEGSAKRHAALLPAFRRRS